MNPGHLVTIWVNALCNQPSSHGINSLTFWSMLCESIPWFILIWEPSQWYCVGLDPLCISAFLNSISLSVIFSKGQSAFQSMPLYCFQPNRMWQGDYVKRLGALFLYLSVYYFFFQNWTGQAQSCCGKRTWGKNGVQKWTRSAWDLWNKTKSPNAFRWERQMSSWLLYSIYSKLPFQILSCCSHVPEQNICKPPCASQSTYTYIRTHVLREKHKHNTLLSYTDACLWLLLAVGLETTSEAKLCAASPILTC